LQLAPVELAGLQVAPMLAEMLERPHSSPPLQLHAVLVELEILQMVELVARVCWVELALRQLWVAVAVAVQV
jgi:hypothetical protein